MAKGVNMTLDEFVDWLKEKADEFKEYYEQQIQDDSANYPATGDDEHDWMERFNDYI